MEGAEIEVASWEPDHRQSGQGVAGHHDVAAVHGQGAADAENSHEHINYKEILTLARFSEHDVTYT